jgi:hypothetical protein
MHNHFMGAGRFLGFDFDWSFRQCIGCHKPHLVKKPDSARHFGVEWCRFPKTSYQLLASPAVLSMRLNSLSARLLDRDTLLRFFLRQYPTFNHRGQSMALGRAFSPEYNASSHMHAASRQMGLVERSILESARLLTEYIDSCKERHGESQVVVPIGTADGGCPTPSCVVYASPPKAAAAHSPLAQGW